MVICSAAGGDKMIVVCTKAHLQEYFQPSCSMSSYTTQGRKDYIFIPEA